MRKITLLLAFVAVGLFANAQAKKQLNFGIVGASLEFPVSSAITIAPAVYSNLDLSYLTVGVKANYYFDELFGINDSWDVYGGANAGYGLGIENGSSSEINIGLQIGGRWFWSEKWGVYVESGGGSVGGANGGVGITMVL